MCSHFDSDEIARLGKRFKKLDLDNSGSLSVDEFMRYMRSRVLFSNKHSLPELHQNPLVQRVIEIFDQDGNGEVDFKEFIEGVSQFSVKGDKDSKLKCEILKLTRFRSKDKFSRVSNLWHGQRRFHLERRALSGAENDGRNKSQR